ncbi:hypothetical protein IQ07DRAFT_634331 [Pyrenochaeta sp. DS3sAY3a]|nr:hypothetical protein IQ07DRAFT_634331 [Pyrenochaeta sp. DS3sAY3a]
MTRYETVPLDEDQARARVAASSAGHDATAKAKQHIRIYGRVASDDAPSEESSAPKSELCVNRYMLLGLATFFACSTLVIGVLYHFSSISLGLTSETHAHRYAWLYGPTAVVVLLRVIWRVVDLKTKGTAPWHELANGPAPARNTILLEYLSPSPLPAIWKSYQNRHWAVTMTVVGELLLLLATVFITGLFTLENTFIREADVPLRRNDFNTSNFNVSTLDASPALLSLAIQSQNLSYPKGTSLDTVVPLFEPDQHRTKDVNTQAIVNGVKVSVECEKVDVTNATTKFLPWYSIRAPQFTINITTPACNLTNVRIGYGPNHGQVENRNATQAYQGTMGNYVCNSGLDYSQPWGKSTSAYNWANGTEYLKSLNRTLDDRLVVSMIDYHMVPTNTTAGMPAMWIHQMTALLCKPKYSINEYRVDYSDNITDSHIELIRETNDALDNMYAGDISKAMYRVFSDYNTLYIGMGGVDFQFSADAIQPFIQMLTLLHGGEKSNFTLKNLMDTAILKSSAESMLIGTMTQALHRNAMSAISDSIDPNLKGTLSYHKDRLFVKALSAGFLCACFGLLSILCVAICFVAPRKPATDGAIGSTLTVAAALQSNPELRQIFVTTNARHLKKGTEAVEFFTRQHPETGALGIDFVAPPKKLESASTHSSDVSKTDADAPVVEWWRPASSRSWYMGLTIALSLAIIGLLEGIQQLSDKRNGFMNLDAVAIDSAILSQYIPAAIVLGITIMFLDIEMIVATFASFTALKKGNAPSSRSLALDYFTRSGPHVFISSIVNRHFALSIILVTTFVASFLAIVIPGLYTQIEVPVTTETTLQVEDQFSPQNVDISLDDRRAGTMLNLLTYYDISYPAWTYEDLSLTQLRIVEAGLRSASISNSSSSTIMTRSNAIRARLKCEPLVAPLNWTIAKPDPESSGLLSASAYLPWSMCSSPPTDLKPNSSTPWVNWRFALNETNPAHGKYYVGQASVLTWSEDDVRLWSGYDDESNAIYPQQFVLPEWGCPSLTFTFGTLSFRNESRNATTPRYAIVNSDISTLVCSQHLQSVETNMTLHYPSMDIVKESPPQPDKKTAKWLRNPADKSGGTAFQFVPNNMMISFNNPNGSMSGPWYAKDYADRFTQALVYVAQKENNLGLSDLAGQGKSAAYESMLQKMYGRYMAQALSNNMRVSLDDKNASSIAFTDAAWTATATPVIVPTPSWSSRVIPVANRTTTVRFSSSLSRISRSAATASATTTLVGTRPNTTTPTPTSPALEKRAEATQSSIPATLTLTGEDASVRLKQNRAPKIALQAMLGFMVVGLLATRLLLDTRETLPREPYSIAGRAVLVANGNVLDDDAQGGGSESSLVGGGSGGRREGEWRFRGRYRLGWWEDWEGRRRYGVCVER